MRGPFGEEARSHRRKVWEESADARERPSGLFLTTCEDVEGRVERGRGRLGGAWGAQAHDVGGICRC